MKKTRFWILDEILFYNSKATAQLAHTMQKSKVEIRYHNSMLKYSEISLRFKNNYSSVLTWSLHFFLNLLEDQTDSDFRKS